MLLFESMNLLPTRYKPISLQAKLAVPNLTPVLADDLDVSAVSIGVIRVVNHFPPRQPRGRRVVGAHLVVGRVAHGGSLLKVPIDQEVNRIWWFRRGLCAWWLTSHVSIPPAEQEDGSGQPPV
jgi:hypothetical protein